MPRDGSLRAPLDAALGDEIARIELRLARTWQALGAFGVVLSVALGKDFAGPLALWGSTASVLFIAWFSFVAETLKSGRGTPALRTATAVIEGTVPWVMLVVIARSAGPGYALASWVPPMLAAGILLASTVRLRPLEPLLFGLVGAVVYLVAYFAWLRGALPPALAASPIFRPEVQVSRSVSLAVGGVLAMLVSRTLRRAIGRADHVARERELFGKYRLLRHVASGGMGSVHEALYCPEGGFERPVAVKRVHPHLAHDDAFISLFRNEAELSARLVHPNIVQVLDFGSVDGTYFLAMELVDGLSLRAVSRRARAAGLAVPPSVAALVAREILAGLAYSHDGARAADGSLLRVVHRDLCPANVLLSRNGEVKISDFGVARALRDAESTHTRTVAGHTAYMAPEQARAQPFDARADLFALGVIVWELLAARPLFNRGAEGPTLLALMSDDIPPPSTLVPDLDPAWDAFVLRTIERDPARRFPSAAAMSAALSAIPDARVPATDTLAALVVQALALPDPPPDEDVAGRGADAGSEVATRVAGHG
jgi:serine/threonine-protein kinase